MDRQCKKLHWSIYSAPDSAKKNNNSNLHMDRQCKKTTAIYIWTDSAKKQQQFTYGQYIFTDKTLAQRIVLNMLAEQHLLSHHV